MRSRSGLSAPGLLGGFRWLLLSKKLRRIPEVHVESLDLFNEHQDGAAGRSDLFARVARQALTPAAERLEFLLIEDCVARCIRQGPPRQQAERRTLRDPPMPRVLTVRSSSI